MATTKRLAASSKRTTSRRPSNVKTKASTRRFVAGAKRRMDDYLARRPHRSFRLTRRRDYVRQLRLPGYFAFTAEVVRLLRRHWKLFGLFVLTYAVVSGLLVGLSSQANYSQLGDLLKNTSGDVLKGNLGAVGKAGLLLVATLSGDAGQATAAPSLVAPLLGLLAWLTAVWLLRAIMAGHRPKLRDGLYNAGAPVVATLLVLLVLLVQLIPMAIVFVGFGAAESTGFLDVGFISMLFWVLSLLLVLISLYWVVGTAMALVVVTLPGMYPMQALRTAGDMVVGRRLRILLRLLWMGLSAAVLWAVVMITFILFDGWLKSVWPVIDRVPLVPAAIVAMGALTLLWAASYVYLLYRRIVDDDAAPA